MLQQTQVSRVIPKFEAFMQQFPTVQSLAQAELGEVLIVWSGLGYNRRAKFLWQAAQRISHEHADQFPKVLTELVKLPGIGNNTAGAIVAYAFNQPVVFIETNIRSVYIHHFFTDQEEVTDKQLIPLIELTLNMLSVREWYWALMDYGSNLKMSIGNAAVRSKTYSKQSAFHGSKRQIRGQVLKQLAQSAATFEELQFLITDGRLEEVLADLMSEKLIKIDANGYCL